MHAPTPDLAPKTYLRPPPHTVRPIDRCRPCRGSGFQLVASTLDKRCRVPGSELCPSCEGSGFWPLGALIDWARSVRRFLKRLRATSSQLNDMRRNRRKRDIRARTVSVKRMTKRELELGRALFPEPRAEHPKTRGDCLGGPRPCPLVGCRYNLFLDVSPRTGAIKLNFPDREPEDMPPTQSCALDLADLGGLTLEDTGEVMNVTRERVRQVETVAFKRVLPVIPSDLAAEMQGRLT